MKIIKYCKCGGEVTQFINSLDWGMCDECYREWLIGEQVLNRQPSDELNKESDIFYTRQWRCFTLDHDKGEAKDKFISLYGVEPEYIVENGLMLWVGPIPKEQGRKEGL